MLKKTALSRRQIEKITRTRTICNVPVDDIDISNLLSRTAYSTGLVIVKLKSKLEYGGHVLFEAVRSAFLCNILYYLRENNHLYKDIIVKPKNISGDLITLVDTHTNRQNTRSDNEDETLNLADLLVNQLDIPIPKNIEKVFKPEDTNHHSEQ